MTKLPYRELVPMCAIKETYKYFFAKDSIEETWRLLGERYGPLRRDESLKTMQIESREFLFRSTWLANPITVIRKRGCSEEHLREFHALVGYEG
jgi:hypothetical protein